MKAVPLAVVPLLLSVLAHSLAFGQSATVMTWNIRYDNPADGMNAWPKRRDWVAEIVLREKTDIAGFQEVLARQYKDLLERLPQMDSYGVGRDDGKLAGEMVPIFYRRARYELLDKGRFWLSDKPDAPGKGWDAALPRIACWVQLRDRETKQTLYVLNTHFDHRGAEARKQSAALLVKQVRTRFADHPVLLLGDLNSTPDSPPYKTLADASHSPPLLRDAYLSSQNKVQGGDSTWNGFNKIVPGARIDYVFATASFAIKQLKTLEDQRDDRFPSDHLPVVVQIELN